MKVQTFRSNYLDSETRQVLPLPRVKAQEAGRETRQRDFLSQGCSIVPEKFLKLNTKQCYGNRKDIKLGDLQM